MQNLIYSLEVQTANSICIESKKKNMTNSDIDAPRGKQSACMVSSVANLSEITAVYQDFKHVIVTFIFNCIRTGREYQ